MIGRRAAAAADDVQKAAFRELPEQAGGVFRRFVVPRVRKRIGESRVRVAADVGVGDVRQLLDIGAHEFRAQCAVQAHCDRPRVAQGIPEGFRSLAGEGAPGLVGDGPGHDDRKAPAAFVEQRLDREDRRLGVQRVENGLEENQVGAAVDESLERLAIDLHELVEIDVAETRVVDFGRDRRGLVGRSEHAGDEARLARVALHRAVRRFAGELGRGVVQFVHQALQAVVGLRRSVRVEGVGLDDVGPGLEVLVVDLANHLRMRQGKEIVVALQVARRLEEALAAEVRLRELVALDGRAHRAVQYQDAALEQSPQLFASVRSHSLL